MFYKPQIRLIIAKSKEDKNRVYRFICNNFDLSAKEIADAYKRRWDIEVFFRDCLKSSTIFRRIEYLKSFSDRGTNKKRGVNTFGTPSPSCDIDR
ncbi:MAG: transposase [Culturomica sp.]|nr:transposase [Culturomica sp.]